MVARKWVLRTICFILFNFSWCASADAVDAGDMMRAVFEGADLEDLPISTDDREIIEYWLDASDVDDVIRCSVSYIRRLRQQLETDRQRTTMSNIDMLYNHVRFMIMWHCGSAVFQQARRLEPVLFQNGHFLNGVGSDFNKWFFHADEVSFRYMSEWMLWLIGVDKRADQQEFMQAWRNGPCSAVLSELEKPTMEEFENYMRLVSESQFDCSQLNQSRLRHYIKIVQSCQYLQNEAILQRVWNALQVRDADVENNFRAEATIGYNHDAFHVFTSTRRGAALQDQPIIERDQSLVHSWLTVMQANDDTRCSVNTMRMLKRKLESDKQTTLMSNVDEMYQFVVQDILSSCGKKVMKKMAEFGLLLREQSLLGVFGSKFHDFIHKNEETYQSMRVLAEWMLWMTGVERRSDKASFIEAWSNGPCRPVRAKLTQPDFRSVANYIDMVDESQLDPLKLKLSVAGSYIPFIQGCRYFRNNESLSEIWYALQIRDAEIEERVRRNALLE